MKRVSLENEKSAEREGEMVPQERQQEQKDMKSVLPQPASRASRPPASPSLGMSLLSSMPTPRSQAQAVQETATELSTAVGTSVSVIGPSPLARDQKEREQLLHDENPYEGRESTHGYIAKEHGFHVSGALLPATGADEPPREATANYYEWRDVFPELEILVNGMADIVAECEQVAAWKAWPEKHYDEGGKLDWKVYPFMHTFPAHDESRRTWVESTCVRCPATTKLLRRLPNIRTALFSRLGGGSRIAGHQGWADLANHVLRCHLPLRVPSSGTCGLWVDGEIRQHTEGEIIVFDDSKLHKAFNDSTEDRLVLIVDMRRPSWIPLGIADGEHTAELDAFIDAFR